MNEVYQKMSDMMPMNVKKNNTMSMKKVGANNSMQRMVSMGNKPMRKKYAST